MSQTLSQLQAQSLVRAASNVFRPTKPEYEDSFGSKLSDLFGRSRWLIAGRAASLWPGLPNTGLRDTIQAALKSPENEVYKGIITASKEILLECYMIGYSVTCAHPTVIICHPLKSVLARSVKVVSKYVKVVS